MKPDQLATGLHKNGVTNSTWQLSRRTFITASAGLVLSRWLWAETRTGTLLYWPLADRADHAIEKVSSKEDSISSRTGHAIWIGEDTSRAALRLDGYSVWIEHASSNAILLKGGLTLAAWVALEAYPVNDAAVVQLGSAPAAGLLIDKWGYLQLAVGEGDRRKICRADRPVPRGKWVHLAATVDNAGSVSIYQDALLCGHLSGLTETIGQVDTVTLGKWSESPSIARVFPTGVLNGLMREVQAFAGPETADAIQHLVRQSQPATPADLEINRAWCAEDRQRPQYHAQPPRAWTNEPHGCIYWRGQYHLFYQKNANGPYWGNINWGHLTSPDLYRWTEQPVALSPEHGPDAEGCWSGSVIEYKAKLVLIYTGGDGHRASICLAMSDDGLHFTKHPGNPVIAAPPEGHNYPEFRDPFVWLEAETYYLLIGSAVKDVGGTALLYRSRDLLTWEYLKPLLIGDKATSGTFWEMPVFVKVDQYHVLIVCEVPGRASYWVGMWKNESFSPLSAEPQRLELFNHLLSPTPHTAADGRVITMGIIPDQRSPQETWQAGWAHLYSLPRVLSIDSDGRLRQNPLEGIDKWSQPFSAASEISLSEGVPHIFDGASDKGMVIVVQFKRGRSRSVSLYVRRSPDAREQTELRYDWDSGTMTLDRSRSSLNPRVKRDVQTTIYKTETPDAISLVLYLDESVLEVFVDERAAFATRVYPTLEESAGIAAACVGGGAIIASLSARKVSLDLQRSASSMSA